MQHSRLPASAAARWIRCPGSIAYIEYLKAEKKLPQDFSGDAARLGTAVHHIIEHCVINQVHPETLTKKQIKRIIKHDPDTKGLVVDEKGIAGATTCYNRVELIRDEFDEIVAEQKYDLSFIYDIDVGGTCDISGYKQNGLLGIEDYKNGRVVVEVDDNYQLQIYALGAYHHENEWYNFKKVRTTIIQPNASHPEGRIRSAELTVKKLLTWEEKVMAPAISLIAKETATLTPGPIQCTWCEARHVCEANAKQTLQLVHIDFQNVAEPKPELPAPQSLSHDQLAFILDNKARILSFLNKCEEYSIKTLEKKGGQVGDYILEEKLGNRVFIEEKKLNNLLRKARLTIKECQTTPVKHMMSVTQLESYLKNEKNWDKDKIIQFMDTITDKPVKGTKLSKSVKNADFQHKLPKPRKSKNRKIRK